MPTNKTLNTEISLTPNLEAKKLPSLKINEAEKEVTLKVHENIGTISGAVTIGPGTYNTDGGFILIKVFDSEDNLKIFNDVFEEFSVGALTYDGREFTSLRNLADFKGVKQWDEENDVWIYGTKVFESSGDDGTLRNTDLNGALFYAVMHHNDLGSVGHIFTPGTDITLPFDYKKKEGVVGDYRVEIEFYAPYRPGEAGSEAGYHTVQEFEGLEKRASDSLVLTFEGPEEVDIQKNLILGAQLTVEKMVLPKSALFENNMTMSSELHVHKEEEEPGGHLVQFENNMTMSSELHTNKHEEEPQSFDIQFENNMIMGSELEVHKEEEPGGHLVQFENSFNMGAIIYRHKTPAAKEHFKTLSAELNITNEHYDPAFELKVDTSLNWEAEWMNVWFWGIVLEDPEGVVIDWGDGNIEEITDFEGEQVIDHVYSFESSGIYDVKIKGKAKRIALGVDGESEQGWHPEYGPRSYGTQIAEINSDPFKGIEGITSTKRMFLGVDNAIYNSNPADWDISNITDMSYMFAGEMYGMGMGEGFNQNINGWDISNVTNIEGMFSHSQFNQPLNNWDVSHITSFKSLFANNYSFNQDISGWNVSSGIDFEDMFFYCNSFNQDISGWNVSSGTNFKGMFAWCKGLQVDLSTWNMSNATSLEEMFSGGNSEDLLLVTGFENWNVSNVTNMKGMFKQCREFNVDISGWNVSNVTNFAQMFFRATPTCSLNGWNVSSAENMEGMFWESEYNQSLNNWNVSSVTNMETMFQDSDFNQPLNNWNVSNVLTTWRMFIGSNFNQDISNWVLSSATDVKEMFSNSDFNQDISSWDPSLMPSIAGLFSGSNFNYDISHWDVSSHTNFSDLFSNCPFNQPIGDWDMSNAYTLERMFNGNTAFNQDISKWDVSNVVSLNSMFLVFNGNSPFNQDISNWNTKSVGNITGFLSKASNFKQDLSKWAIPGVSSPGTIQIVGQGFFGPFTGTQMTEGELPQYGTHPYPHLRIKTDVPEGVGEVRIYNNGELVKVLDTTSKTFTQTYLDFASTGVDYDYTLVAGTRGIKDEFTISECITEGNCSSSDKLLSVTLSDLPQISGKVTKDGVGVEGAKIRMMNENLNSYVGDTLTDVNGDYSISGFWGETYHLTAEYQDGDNKYNALSKWSIDPENI